MTELYKQVHGFDFIELNKTASTNKYALEWLADHTPKNPTLIFTGHQTSGRGQGLNTWESEAYKNITTSAILSPSFLQPSRQFLLSIIVSLAIIKTVKPLIPTIPLKIKWPNDIYAFDRKLAGILIHHSILGNSIEYTVCGIGLNVNQLSFSSDIPNPVSLKLLSDKDYDCMILLESLAINLIHYFKLLKKGMEKQLNEEYHNYLYRRNEETGFMYQGKEISAFIQGIDEFGRLKLKSGHKDLLCEMKEIQMLHNRI